MTITHTLLILGVSFSFIISTLGVTTVFIVARQMRAQRAYTLPNFEQVIHKYTPQNHLQTQTTRVVRLKEFSETEQFVITVNGHSTPQPPAETAYQEAS
ncbi:MAG: hypothetical protein OHK0046_05670 [Anaerolineae bacterium]